MATADSTAPVEYRQVPEFPNYRVGTDGSVWSRWNAQWGTREWHRISTRCGKSGYPQVSLYHYPRRLRIRVHRLVLLAFAGPCPDGMEACHGNDVKTDCRLENLRWDTCSSNKRDALRNGRMPTGSSRPNSKFTEEQIVQIRKLRRSGCQLKTIASKFNVSISNISNISRGLTWKHVPM